MTEVATFADFYKEVTGKAPFPWQLRLAEEVVSRGWPKEICVPTGLGKTSCLDIAVWALGYSAARVVDRMPTRTWYVVNRRLLVDAAYQHGEDLSRLLGSANSGAIGTVARALRGLAAAGTEESPLYVTRLRGGAELGARPPDPSQPAIVFATVPMFASRWLFRGYGSSPYSRPIDAAHAGIDSLVLLDEAHLSRPLLRLGRMVAQCDVGDPSAVVPSQRSRPVFVAITATGEEVADRFELDDLDKQHPVVHRRLYAVKRGTLVPTSQARLVDDLADQALRLLGDRPETCVVFTNTPTVARQVARRLSSRKSTQRQLDVLLLTGRVRDREGEKLREVLLQDGYGVKVGSAGRTGPPRAVVVVATQTLEVGADVDFHHLVTETAGVRSMVQRLGRVNRLGERTMANCVLCHAVDRQVWPVYGEEPRNVWARLEDAVKRGKDLDLHPANLSMLLGLPQDEPARTGELLPSHLWEWAKTSRPPSGEAPVELFFDGFGTDIDVSIVWRASRPGSERAPQGALAGQRLVPSVTEWEAVEVPLSEAREVLKARMLSRLADDRATLEPVAPEALRPGDTVVLSPDVGLYDQFGWAPESTEVVLDVSAFRSGMLLLDEELLLNLVPNCPLEVRVLFARLADPPDDEEFDEPGEVAMLLGKLRSLGADALHPWLSIEEWSGFVARLGSEVSRPVDGLPFIGPSEDRRKWASVAVRSDSLEELSFTASSHVLREHLGAVGEMAARFAACLDVAPGLARALQLAGEWHDLGKHDPRFQRWMDPDAQALEPLAKSALPRDRWEASRSMSGWPKGGRHELLSVRLALAWLERHSVDVDKDLVLHLVSSHHGGGRPFVGVVHDPAPPVVAATLQGEPVTVSGALSTPDWDQPRRFREVCERYGFWGVALLETLLKQADAAVSGLTTEGKKACARELRVGGVG